MENHEARLNITFDGNNGDLPDPVSFDSTEADIKAWATEAIAEGSVPGIPATASADFTDFVVDRFSANDEVGHARIMIRPKTPFGV